MVPSAFSTRTTQLAQRIPATAKVRCSVSASLVKPFAAKRGRATWRQVAANSANIPGGAGGGVRSVFWPPSSARFRHVRILVQPRLPGEALEESHVMILTPPALCGRTLRDGFPIVGMRGVKPRWNVMSIPLAPTGASPVYHRARRVRLR